MFTHLRQYIPSAQFTTPPKVLPKVAISHKRKTSDLAAVVRFARTNSDDIGMSVAARNATLNTVEYGLINNT